MSILSRFAVLAAIGTFMSVLAVAQTTPLDTTTSLSATGSQTGPQGTVFILHAAVTDTHGPVLYGSVTFYNGDPSSPTASLGTVVINKATGIATLRTGSFTVGTHSITARFTGTNNDAPSASADVDLTVTVNKKSASSVTLHALQTNGHNQLSAWVTGLGPQPLDGTVTFTDTTTHTVLGTAPVNTSVLGSAFGAQIQLPNHNNGHGPYLAIADFNNDGNLDLLAKTNSRCSGSCSLSAFLGQGNGTFTSSANTSLNFTGYGNGPVAVGDLNNDGNLDIIVPCTLANNQTGVLCILFGNGDGTFRGPYSFTVGQPINSLAIADFNGDGKLDFVAAWEAVGGFFGGVTLFTNHGNGNFDGQIIYRGPTTQVTAVDFNVDNKTDLIIGATNVSPQILLNHGNGTFAMPVSGSNLAAGTPFIVGDFNGDGKPDIAIYDTQYGVYGAIEIGLGHGDANGTFEISHINSDATSISSLLTSDFNGDGKLDLYVASGSASYYYYSAFYLGHGNGTFSIEPASVEEQYPYLYPIPQFAADLNNDGIPDLESTLIQPYATAGAAYTGQLPDPTHTITATYNGNDVFTTSTSAPIHPVAQP